MRSGFRIRVVTAGAILGGLLCLAAQSVAAAQDSTTKPSTAHKTAKKRTKSPTSSAKQSAANNRASTGKHSRSKSRSRKKRGQQAIDSERARQIQQALIRQHYMQGEPSGRWDAATEAALRRFQGDQGWQTKTVPDSRALIKLGLGPSKDGLLNPESAMTTPSASADPKQDSTNTRAIDNKPQP